MPPRAVITGIGVLSPIGIGVKDHWAALLAGRSGVKKIQSFDTSGLPIHIGGEMPEFEAKNYVDKKERKSLKMMARPIQMGLVATNTAIQDAGIDTSTLDPTRFGIDYGAGLIASELDELGPAAATSCNGKPRGVDMLKWGNEGLAAMPPLWLLKYLPNMPACHVSILRNAQGPSNTITETDAAPTLALGEAYRIIERGLADVMLTGGTDSKMNPVSLTRFSLFAPLTKRNDAPEQASRPFDKGRDGFVPGEGAGIMVLEELEHARKRNARIYGEVVGFGSAFDAKRDGDGLARAIAAALKQAGVGPDQVDHVNAQGFSTVVDDALEAHGIQKVFGDNIPVFAGKSYTGSLGAASGAVELAASIFALQEGTLPATLNYDEPDPECPVAVATSQRQVAKDYAVKVSFTDLGQCAAVVIKKWKE